MSVIHRVTRLTLVFVLVLLAAVTSVSAQVEPCNPVVDYATAAMIDFDGGDYEASLPNLYCATGLDPQNIDIQAAYFEALQRTGHISTAYGPSAVLGTLDPARFDQIIADAEAALAADPTDQGALIILCGARLVIDQAEIDQLLALDPESAVAYAYRGASAIWTGSDADAARAAIERAVELAPNDPEILSFAAQIHLFGIGDTERALALIEQAIAVDPNFAPVYADRSSYYAQTGNLEMATLSLSQAIALNPYNYTQYNQRGVLSFQQENYPAALDDFRYVLSVNPASPTALESIIEISLLTGSLEDRVLAADSFLNARSEIVESRPLIGQAPMAISINAGRMVRVPVRLEAGKTVIISAVASDPASLDPLLVVIDPAGGAVSYNDDVDLEGGDYSAVVTITPEVTGRYFLLATHSGAGSRGEMMISIADAELRF
ncbi:MAG: hypothetical protein KME04_04270 [Pleurocapsa minor GSE-CHR-MK-17-07R]|jgi:tetratricopeptide (TPR) repeat protein|nr:hypothetical protein [Pleurocapsa minor GSE-CHR-MK 17-07R]